MPGELADFTPFGYLRNPAHQATSWGNTTGGNLRTAPDLLGVEWAYPVGRDPSTRVGLFVETQVDGRACRSRDDFDAIGLRSPYHTALMVGFDWQLNGVHVEARFFLADDHAVCARVWLKNRAAESRCVLLTLGARVDSSELATEAEAPLTELPRPHVLVGGERADLLIAPGTERQLVGIVARDATIERALKRARAAVDTSETAYKRILQEDEHFSARCPTLSGNWPAHWAEGLHHDFQTTRLLIQPPGGIFRDVWPAWMAAWPRVVLAEGTLDMLRLAYADPELAQRAVLSLFRDAPRPNVPCVFIAGEPNMVASDGSICGTSPAWCLPFLNLELLYLRTLDRTWLRQVYPFASAYLHWWLEHRVDKDKEGGGWLTCKCTWESGEDGNPRLDPSGSGDGDISGRSAPVELQATMSHAATVMAFFASELRIREADDWRRIADEYRHRTRQLFDPEGGRFRDRVIADQHLQAPCPETPYWGIDPCRYSAQSLTPLLIGESLDPDEVWRHAGPPWTLWPSWTWSLVESAAAAGLWSQERFGTLLFDTLDRVYRITTRRQLAGLTRPMPGSSPEFWPEDWRTYGGSDAYGWGATTANLLLRHLFGFRESRRTDEWLAELAPAFPRAMLRPGREYGLRKLNYRGLTFDLAYAVVADGLQATLDLGSESRICSIESGGEIVHKSPRPSTLHRFPLAVGRPATLTLR